MIWDSQKNLSRDIRDAVLQIAEDCKAAGGRALIVGGCVRDAAMGELSKDADIEVYGLPVEKLEGVLDKNFRFDEVGKSFGVFKLKGLAIDVALPRKESKIGLGHQAFSIEGDPFLTFEAAASRRDFTINAMGVDPLTGEWMDPYGGLNDLKAKMLRHAGPAFSEDPLRVLRGMQLIARFGLTPAKETIQLCQTMTLEGLSKERLFEEWRKLLLKGVYPSQGLAFLKETGWVRYFPALAATIGCEQDPVWHPEGDVWVHTGYCLDAFAHERVGDDWEDLVVGFAVLCHDLGKPLTTQAMVDGRLRSLGHDVAGEAPTRAFLGQLTEHKALIEAVVPLVLCHMRPQVLFKDKASDAAIRRLAAKVERIDRLVRVLRADKGGRPPLPQGDCPEGVWLLERAKALQIASNKPTPILLGRHLMEMGMAPSPLFSVLLNKAYEAQLDGVFNDLAGAKAFIEAEKP